MCWCGCGGGDLQPALACGKFQLHLCNLRRNAALCMWSWLCNKIIFILVWADGVSTASSWPACELLFCRHSVPARIRAPLVNRAPVSSPFSMLWYLCWTTIKLLEMSQQFRAKSKPTGPDWCSSSITGCLQASSNKMLLQCQSFYTGTKRTSWFNTDISHSDIQITGWRHEGTSLNKPSGEKNQVYLDKEGASSFLRNFAGRCAGLPGKEEAIRRRICLSVNDDRGVIHLSTSIK